MSVSMKTLWEDVTAPEKKKQKKWSSLLARAKQLVKLFSDESKSYKNRAKDLITGCPEYNQYELFDCILMQHVVSYLEWSKVHIDSLILSNFICHASIRGRNPNTDNIWKLYAQNVIWGDKILFWTEHFCLPN